MKNQVSHPIVEMQLFRGNEILKREDGSIKTENQFVKYFHGTVEWEMFKNSIRNLGYGRYKLISVIHHNVTEATATTERKVESVEAKKEEVAAIEAELKAVFDNPKAVKSTDKESTKEKDELIQSQAETIADLMKRMEALEANQGKTEETEVKKTEDNSENQEKKEEKQDDQDVVLFQQLCKEYTTLTGKLPKASWKTAAQMSEEIDKASKQ